MLKQSSAGSSQSLTPAPSSDAAEEIKDEETEPEMPIGHRVSNGLPSPITPAGVADASEDGEGVPAGFYSPSRKVSYAVIALSLLAKNCVRQRR